MTTDDAHALVRNALAVLDGTTEDSEGLGIADLNETERARAVEALRALKKLDGALAARSDIPEHSLGGFTDSSPEAPTGMNAHTIRGP